MPMPDKLSQKAERFLTRCPHCRKLGLKRYVEIDGHTGKMVEKKVKCSCGKAYNRSKNRNQTVFEEVDPRDL